MRKIPVFFAIILSLLSLNACKKEEAYITTTDLSSDYKTESVLLENALVFPPVKVSEESVYYLTLSGDDFILNRYSFPQKSFTSMKTSLKSDCNIASFNVDSDGNSYYIFTQKEGELFNKYIQKNGSDGKPLFKVSFDDSRFSALPTLIFTSDGLPAVAGKDMYALISDSGEISKESIEDSFLSSTFLDFDWEAAGIDSNSICEYCVISEDKANAVLFNESAFTAVTIERTAEKANREKKLVIAALTNIQQVKKMARDYRKTQGEYDVIIRDYSQYDYDNAVTHLFSDIISGEQIDIVSLVPGIDHSNMVENGIYADLSAYIEKSDNINPDSFFASVYDTALHNGVRYAIPSVFSFQAVATRSKAFYSGIDTAKISNYISEFGSGSLIREEYDLQLASILLMLRINEYFNESSGSADFSKESFMDAAMAEKEVMHSSSVNSGAALKEIAFSGPEEWVHYILSNSTDLRLIGYPSETGNSALIFEGSGMFALCEKSKNKDASYGIIEFAYLQGLTQDHAMFVADKTVFKQNLEMIFNSDEHRIPESIDKDALINDVMNLVESGKSLSITSETIVDIIFEELNSYVHGSKSIENSVEIINNRVNLYLQENGLKN